MVKKLLEPVKIIGKTTFSGLIEHGVLTFAAAIAFYAIFALPGLLITVTLVAGIFLDKSTVETELIAQLQTLIGEQPASTLETLLDKIKFSEENIWKTLFGVGTLLFSATTIFVSLQEALNRIWDVRATSEQGFLKQLKSRVLSFGLIISLGFLLLVSLLLDTLLEMFFNSIENASGKGPAFWIDFFNEAISVVVVVVIIYLIFKFLPDVILGWKDISFATLLTAGLLILGKYLIGLYIGASDFSKSYDAAGSVVVILIWVYYSTIVLLFGAEITRAIMIYRGRPIRPANGAKKIKVQEIEFEEYKSNLRP